ncbi:MAG: ABC transporter substrate-binding protein [Bradymonadaceae bacterium]|nr:ABC transporter substrate-binding protein [Lujinxingiaceae bacterium]
MSKRFKVGGVPEHFNLPWYRAAEREVFANDALEYSWRVYPGGTGEMLTALEDDELDVAVLLTEGVVAHIARGGDAAIVGTFVDSPLIWGVHVHADSPHTTLEDLRARPFAISRLRSGSHIMAYVLAQQMGWLSEKALEFELVRDLEGARSALAQGRGDAFMWEKYTTKPLVDSGEWRRIGTCTTPWPPFVLAAKRGFVATRAADIDSVFKRVHGLCQEMTDEPAASVSEIVARFGQREEDVREWLAQTHWACAREVDLEQLAGVVETLLSVEVIDQAIAPQELVVLG